MKFSKPTFRNQRGCSAPKRTRCSQTKSHVTPPVSAGAISFAARTLRAENSPQRSLVTIHAPFHLATKKSANKNIRKSISLLICTVAARLFSLKFILPRIQTSLSTSECQISGPEGKLLFSLEKNASKVEKAARRQQELMEESFLFLAL